MAALREAVNAKLQSNLPLKDKCVLAANVYLTDSIKLPQKGELIVQWMISVLMKKFSQLEEDAELLPVWNLLLKITSEKYATFEDHFLAATRETFWDLFNSIVDYFCQTSSSSQDLAESWLKMLIRGKRQQIRSQFLRNKGDALNHWIAKCLLNDVLVEDALWLCSLRANTDLSLLPMLLTVKSDMCCKLVSRSLFAKERSNEWKTFLKSIVELTDAKPKSTPMLEKLFLKLDSVCHDDQLRALGVLFKSALMSSATSDQSKSLLFCLCCDVLQVYPALLLLPYLKSLHWQARLYCPSLT